MLRLVIPEDDEWWNERTKKFVTLPRVELDMEHSLVSVSKWESLYEKPFLTPGEKTPQEIFGYLKAMVITPNADLDVLNRCPQSSIDEIQRYIDSRQSATTFSQIQERRGPSGETITSELIYYWMVAAQIPWEAQYWHLNRLLTLIRIAGIKNSKPKKMSRHEIAMRNREENARRRAQYGTKG